jgi:HK97 family phage major capsid protein
MSEQAVREGVVGNDPTSVSLASQIGTFAKKLDDIASEMGKAKNEDTARYDALKAEQVAVAATLTDLKAKHDDEVRQGEVDEAIKAAAEWRAMAANTREPSKAALIGGNHAPQGNNDGDFAYAIGMARSKDAEEQAVGKAMLKSFGERQESWGKATLGTTDATGGWIVPNAIVDDFIKPATVRNIYRDLMTVVPGVTAATIDIPLRLAARSRAVVAAFGATKENVGLVYNGYTATMYTLARIYDVGNQFLRQSRGAAEKDVMEELAAGFALGESYYIREGSGSSEPYGYTTAFTNAPTSFTSSFTPSATTLAGSMAKAIATASGALAGRGVTPSAAVLSAASYWNMVSQGTDTAGFFFAPANGPTNIRPGTVMSPWGIPVYADPGADAQGTAAITDNLIVADWKAFKVFFGENYRVDSSDTAGTRWDTNVTGFRGEEEMGFDARPAVYAGYAQIITDIEP